MRHSYLDIRDKTFTILSRMDGETQHAYALGIQKYMGDKDSYDEMTKFLNEFNRVDDLIGFMNDCVEEHDVIHYDGKLHPALLEARSAMDELNQSNHTFDQEKARRLAFFLLADIKDDYDWQTAEKQNRHGADNNEGGGSNHSADSFELM